MDAIFLISSLLVTGFFCFWISLNALIQMDGEAPRVPEAEGKTEPEAEAPRLTRLGRPIRDIRLRA